ncbi:hypothetical protein QTP88_023441 [Uroleucon formosanum]
MPKVSSSFSSKIREWISCANKNAEVFTSDGKIIFCNACGKQIACERKSQLDQHMKTVVHVSAIKRKFQTQQLISTSSPSSSSFSEDLCFAMVSSDIPLYKLQSKPFRNFLSKYTNQSIPDESSLRKNYLSICYQKTMNEIKEKIGNNFIYVVVDETTDARGLYIANLLVGVLNKDYAGRPYLLASKQLNKTNNETISQFINDSLKLLWTDVGMERRVLLLLTDAAQYMVKSGKSLKLFYSNMIHVTCIAHACNLIAEKVRELFPNINILINNGKKIFLKSPSRISIFKDEMENIPLPPAPVITRWGTWIAAALYYAKYFIKYQKVIEKLAEDDAQCVKKVLDIIKDRSTVNELTFISTHLSFLVEIIKKLESFCLISELEEKINIISGPKGATLKTKLNDIFSKNKGLTVLRNINKVLLGEAEVVQLDQNYKDPMILSSFKFAPITSVDVERSFSIYKHLLTDRRHSFTEEKLEYHLIINFNNKE